MKPTVKHFFDENTWTLTYVVYDNNSKDALIIDPVMDYDMPSSKVSFESNQKVIHFVEEHNLKIHFILESHAHADHLSGSQNLKIKYPQAKIGISSNITTVQKTFKTIYNFDSQFKTDGSQFDVLLNENEILQAGTLTLKTIFTPGHTPACASFLIGDALFVGDALFMPDSGTGRCDFPAGSSNELYTSIHEKLYKLPDTTRVFVGHDYQPDGRKLICETSIGECKQKNIQLNHETSRQEFVNFRSKRDSTLDAPRLLFQSIQVNINAGNLPIAEANGGKYLKIPIR